MLPEPERIIRDVTAGLSTATSVVDACAAVVGELGRHGAARVSVLLEVHDRLRCVAATGSWQVFATVPTGAGVAGRVWSSGRTAVVPIVAEDPDYVPLRPDVTAEICTAIPGAGERLVGVLDLEWVEPVDLDRWCHLAEAVASRLGNRIAELGGPPAESRSEKLLRQVAAMTASTAEWEVRAAATAAARDVSGLPAAVLVLASPDGPQLVTPVAPPGGLEAQIQTALEGAGPVALDRLISRAHRYGAAYTLGEGGWPTEADPIVDAGARTLIIVPIGPPEAGGLLLVAGERIGRPDPTTVNLMELLAAQAWACLDRLRHIARLRERASSDPLTGLRHHGPFGERMAAATPGRTALLAIDVDGFKRINDTYGHQTGDRVLVGLARALESALRQGDELYRIGGDEFVAVVEVSRPDEAVGIAERLTEAARRINRTISVGVAVRRHREPPELTMRRADAALYEAKRRGRDGVRLAAA